MYSKGQRVVVRDKDGSHEEQALVEDIIMDTDGQKVKVKLHDGGYKVVDRSRVVEHLED